uniref:Atrial natriuretic peptide receptor 3 n=2 Tax=Cacopsylla melanoneura TaxID=428564 RepID=A0A8D8V0J3_9HEMI
MRLTMHIKHLKILLPGSVHYFLILHILCYVQSASPNVPGSVRFSVLAPQNPESHEQTIQTILPSIELAVLHVKDPRYGRLPNWNITLNYKDTNCSSTAGPMAAFDLFKQSDVFLGPVCDYVLAPVARYSGVWRIPVLTAGGLVASFELKFEYPTLTRMMGSFSLVGQAVQSILKNFNWTVAGFLFNNYAITTGKGNSNCFFTLSSVYKTITGNKINNDIRQESFDEDTVTPQELKEKLITITKRARIVVLCANPQTVRDILLLYDCSLLF